MSAPYGASAAALLALAGCALPFENADVLFQNTCSASADCGAGAACVEVEAGGSVCVARATDLGPVYLEVRTSHVSGSSTSYLFQDKLVLQGSESGGIVRQVGLTLPPLARLGGSYVGMGGPCAELDGSIPVRVELRTSQAAPGFENQVTVSSKQEGGSHRFEVDVPPGTYDVYVVPSSEAGCEGPPPRMFPGGLVVPEGVKAVEFAPRDEEVQELHGTIQVPQDETLEGWILEVVEPTYGKPVSKSFELSILSGADIVIPPDQGIEYHYTQNALIRLRDPEGDLTVHWLLEVEASGTGEIQLNLRSLVATPEALSATVVDASGPVAGATVTIQSDTLTGSANQNATYRLVTETDAQGVLQVSLVPGTYAVSVVPATPGVGTYFGTWTVTENAGGNGKGFEIPVQPVVRATVLTAGGQPAALAPVVVTPSLQGPSTYFHGVLEVPVPRPREFTGSLDASGRLVLPVDAGKVDLSVQVAPETWFPWVVLPRLVVQPAAQTPTLDLGGPVVPYPVLVRGTVASATSLGAPAVVRAWVPASSESGTASLVQVGATVTDEGGAFVLPLPPTVTSAQ